MALEDFAPRDVSLRLIAAAGENGVIGKASGELPWRLPDDLRRFKALTMGRAMIMGRKTWETLPGALPGRRTIVLTRREGYRAAGAEVAANVDEALALVEADGAADVVGGGDVYRVFMDLASEIELTRVHGEFEGEATFPAIDGRVWAREWSERHEADERHAYAFTFERWRRVGRVE